MLWPIFPWVGGKCHIRSKIEPYTPNPDDYSLYVEPFLGAGAMMLALEPKKAIVNDINPWVIMMWHLCSHHCDFVQRKSDELQMSLVSKTKSECYFDKALETFNKSRTVYESKIPKKICTLDKCTCSTGMINMVFLFYYLVRASYGARVTFHSDGNLRAHFGNLPLTTLYNTNYVKVHEYLINNNITFYSGDYRSLLAKVPNNITAFIYLDPPYHAVEYINEGYHSSDGFSEDEHKKLATVMLSMNQHYIMQSNSNTSFIKTLYKAYGYIMKCFDIQRSISNQYVPTKRKKCECIIMNYTLT